jgi:hypothetical protein
MSEQERFLLTFDSAQGVPVKVERIGESGDLTEVDLQGFLSSLTSSPAASTPQQIVINIYGGGGAQVVEPAEQSKPPFVQYDRGDNYKPKKKE